MNSVICHSSIKYKFSDVGIIGFENHFIENSVWRRKLEVLCLSPQIIEFAFSNFRPGQIIFSRRVRLASRQYHLSLRYKTILSQVPGNLKFSQVNCHSRYSSLRLLKSWPNGLASRRKFWTCVSFGHQLASTCDDLRRLVLTMIELKFGRK